MAIIGNSATTKWGLGVVPASGNAFQVGTNSGNGNGAHLTAGGTWVNGSSIEFKDDFTALDKKEILNKISSLNISRWHYKGTGNEYHIGPIAEEFYQLFNVGTDKKYISTVDPAGIALAGIQQLVQENQESKKTVKQLQKNLEMQQVINEKQQKQIDELVKELQIIKEKIK